MNINELYIKRKEIFKKIENANTTTKILMSIIMAGFTGLTAQIIFKIPGYPIPFTGQTFAVLTSGLILGKRYGALSQTIYLLLGITCIPWFCGMSGGDISALFTPNIGYIIGFILASYFIGYASENTENRKFKRMIIIISLASIIIYIVGLTALALFTSLSLKDVLIQGFIIFIPGDILKGLAATSVSKIFLPKE